MYYFTTDLLNSSSYGLILDSRLRGNDKKITMKSSPKILTILFLLIFILQLACLLFLTLAPNVSLAADPIEFKPQVEIPGLEKEFTKSKTGGYILPQDTGGIAKYIRAIYKYAIGIVGILAAVVLMVGGVMWIMAGGSATMVSEAKAWIGASLTGLTLALLSYLILATVNPALVDLRTTTIGKVTAPTAKNFDASVACGQQVSGQDTICGSNCPAGQTCKKVAKGMPNARECPETLSNNGNYYRCDDCCKNNQDADCPTNSNYICNRHNNTDRCPGQGICTLKQPRDGVCDENQDCQSNNCSYSAVWGTLRCQ